MDWKLIALLSVVGIIMGFLSLRGFTQKIEPVLWLLFGIAASLVISKNLEKPFFHGLVIGVSWGVLNGLLQSVFFDTYLANNPSIQQSFQKNSSLPPRIFVLATAPIIGLITGLILGGLSLLLKKVW